MNREMLKVLQADLTSVCGKRNVIYGEAELLEGFEFNIDSMLRTTLIAPYTAVIYRAAETLKVDIPAFIPLNMVIAPSGATHFKLLTAGTAVDFTNETYEVETSESALLPLSAVATAAISLSNAVSAASVHLCSSPWELSFTRT